MSKPDLIELAEAYIKQNVLEPYALNVPVFFSKLQGDLAEFFDPVYDRYIRTKIWDLYDYLQSYRCGNCGGFHVPYVVDMTDPTRPRTLFFSQFLDLLKEMSKEEDEP
ncbi:MAG: hypothetical protein QXI60_08170 [Thermofilaceae archaeon]